MFKALSEHPDYMLLGLYEENFDYLKLLEYISIQLLNKHLKALMDYF